MVDVFAGIGAFKAMFETAKGLVGIRDSLIRDEAAVGLQRQILAAEQDYAALQQKVRDLEQEVRDLKDWEAEKQRYEYQRIEPGVHLPTHKAGMGGPAGAQHLCPGCYEDGKKSVLQATPETEARYRVHLCPRCKLRLAFGAPGPIAQPSRATSDYDPLDT